MSVLQKNVISMQIKNCAKFAKLTLQRVYCLAVYVYSPCRFTKFYRAKLKIQKHCQSVNFTYVKFFLLHLFQPHHSSRICRYSTFLTVVDLTESHLQHKFIAQIKLQRANFDFFENFYKIFWLFWN